MTSTSTPTAAGPATRRFSRYPAYNDSDVEWLGEIPAHWEVKRLKYLATLSPDALTEQTDPARNISYVDIGGVDSLGRITEREELTFGSAPSRARKLASDGDVILSTVRTYLRAIAAIRDPDPDLVVSTGFAVVRPLDELVAEYAAHALRASYFVERVVAESKGVSFPAITETELATHDVAVPPEPEQRAIAAFLDRETTRIDALVATKERLIELLQEKRTALITRAVTKGLEPNVPMKDSGVKWLGEIPAHWEVKRIRDVAESLQTGPFGSQLHANEYVRGGQPVINPANLRDGHLVCDEEVTVDGATAQRLVNHRLREGDILFARRGELGRCGLVTGREAGWLCGTGCLRLRVNSNVAAAAFLMPLLSTLGVSDWLELESVGATMQNLNTAIVGRVPLALPPLPDQEVIAAFLDQETRRIDALVATVRDAITRLRELRTALISAAVTGKIDVREAAA